MVPDRIGRDELPLTQEYLAQMLGLRRTTVTLLAQAMQVRSLIRYRRGHIVLLDRKGLEECACECYDITRHEKLAPALGVNFQSVWQAVLEKNQSLEGQERGSTNWTKRFSRRGSTIYGSLRGFGVRLQLSTPSIQLIIARPNFSLYCSPNSTSLRSDEVCSSRLPWLLLASFFLG